MALARPQAGPLIPPRGDRRPPGTLATGTVIYAVQNDTGAMLKEVHLRFRHGNCFLLETTQRHPSVTIVVSGVYQADRDVHADVVIHAPNKKDIQQIEGTWRTDPRLRSVRRLYEGPNGARFHVAYPKRLSIYPDIVRSAPLSVGTASVAGGYERLHFVGESKHIDRLLAKLNTVGEAAVESVRTLEHFAPDPTDIHALAAPGTSAKAGAEGAELTDRQLNAVLLAYAAGYYRWPRNHSASDLARLLGVTSTAFLLQLRGGEGQAMGAFAERLLAQDPGRRAAIDAQLRRVGVRPARKRRRGTPLIPAAIETGRAKPWAVP